LNPGDSLACPLAEKTAFRCGEAHGIGGTGVVGNGNEMHPGAFEIRMDAGENLGAPGHPIQPDDDDRIKLPGHGIAEHGAELRPEEIGTPASVGEFRDDLMGALHGPFAEGFELVRSILPIAGNPAVKGYAHSVTVMAKHRGRKVSFREIHVSPVILALHESDTGRNTRQSDFGEGRHRGAPNVGS
jgi:hypothetical protein